MAITQNSKIQIRTGLQQNLPQLAQGEFGFAIDSQRLFIGNGNVSNGAPFAGNTEIATVASGGSYSPVSGTFTGTQNGTNTIFFTIGNVAPIPSTLIVWNNVPLIPNIGYTAVGSQITFTTAPSSSANLYWQGWI
jgi:hypothetical protein